MTTAADDRDLALLAELAPNLRSTWNHSADELWAQIDPELWALTANPWVVLQSAAPERLRELVATSDLRAGEPPHLSAVVPALDRGGGAHHARHQRRAHAVVAVAEHDRYAYGGSIPASRPAADYTPRVVPFHAAASVPLEASAIRWQR